MVFSFCVPKTPDFGTLPGSERPTKNQLLTDSRGEGFLEPAKYWKELVIISAPGKWNRRPRNSNGFSALEFFGRIIATNYGAGSRHKTWTMRKSLDRSEPVEWARYIGPEIPAWCAMWRLKILPESFAFGHERLRR